LLLEKEKALGGGGAGEKVSGLSFFHLGVGGKRDPGKRGRKKRRQQRRQHSVLSPSYSPPLPLLTLSQILFVGPEADKAEGGREEKGGPNVRCKVLADRREGEGEGEGEREEDGRPEHTL
jgi:hypothetical protein